MLLCPSSPNYQTISLWLNGLNVHELNGLVPGGNWWNLGANYCSLGFHRWGVSNYEYYHKGKMDVWRHYNRALNDSEMLDLSNVSPYVECFDISLFKSANENSLPIFCFILLLYRKMLSCLLY